MVVYSIKQDSLNQYLCGAIEQYTQAVGPYLSSVYCRAVSRQNSAAPGNAIWARCAREGPRERTCVKPIVYKSARMNPLHSVITIDLSPHQKHICNCES